MPSLMKSVKSLIQKRKKFYVDCQILSPGLSKFFPKSTRYTRAKRVIISAQADISCLCDHASSRDAQKKCRKAGLKSIQDWNNWISLKKSLTL